MLSFIKGSKTNVNPSVLVLYSIFSKIFSSSKKVRIESVFRKANLGGSD